MLSHDTGQLGSTVLAASSQQLEVSISRHPLAQVGIKKEPSIISELNVGVLFIAEIFNHVE